MAAPPEKREETASLFEGRTTRVKLAADINKGVGLTRVVGMWNVDVIRM
jgi:hypothetical protein